LLFFLCFFLRVFDREFLVEVDVCCLYDRRIAAVKLLFLLSYFRTRRGRFLEHPSKVAIYNHLTIYYMKLRNIMPYNNSLNNPIYKEANILYYFFFLF
jgi:hypothetical protein